MRRCVASFAVLVTLLSAAPRTEPATDSVTLSWDANHDTTSGYRVHVGTDSGVYDQSFDVGSSTSFVYTGGIPGTRYYFAVTAYDADGQESPASNEVSAVLGFDPEPPIVAVSCAASLAGDCRAPRVRADALGPVRGIAALLDGRVLFVENGRHVRVLAPSGLMSAPSLSTNDPDAEFTELVVDPSFGRTAAVFVGTTELRRNGDRDFRVIRYRLVRDTLGEGATIVGGLSFRGEHAPRFTVDDTGAIFVAMPGAGDAHADPYAGRVLRFAADGSIPVDHRGFSPILANSFPVPLDLDWDGRTVWIVGLDEHSQPAVGRLLLDAVAREWPRPLSDSGLETPPGFAVAAFDVSASGFADPSTSSGVIVDTTQRFHRVTKPDQQSIGRLEAMTWSVHGLPVDVAVGPLGSIHVVVKTAAGLFAVIEVGDRQ